MSEDQTNPTREERKALKAQERADLARAKADAARERVAAAATTATREEPAGPGSGDGGRRSRLLPAVLAALSVLLVLAGVFALVRAHDIRSTPAALNRALVDSDATTQVEGEVGNALTKVLSYDYSKPDETKASATQYLTGKARSQYAVLFRALQEKAPGQQLSLTARVSVLGVKKLSGNQASLLVFLDQSSTRATDAQSSLAAAQLRVGATKVKGHWQISSLDPI